MSIEKVTVPRIRCDRLDGAADRCAARVYGDDAALSAETVRVVARERGWSTDGRDLCPSHRSERTS